MIYMQLFASSTFQSFLGEGAADFALRFHLEALHSLSHRYICHRLQVQS